MSDTIPPDAPEKPIILIIDDDVPLCKVTATVLSASGYTTFTANTGEDGIEQFKRHHPDIIFLDVALPGISGFEVAAAIRKLQTEENHPFIVIVTAYAQSFLVGNELHLGIDNYLTKPVLPEDLLDQIKMLTQT